MTTGEKKGEQLELRVSLMDLARKGSLKKAKAQTKPSRRNNSFEPVGKSNTTGELTMTEMTKDELIHENTHLKKEVQRKNEELLTGANRMQIAVAPLRSFSDAGDLALKTFVVVSSAALAFYAVGGLVWAGGKLVNMVSGSGGTDGGGA